MFAGEDAKELIIFEHPVDQVVLGQATILVKANLLEQGDRWLIESPGLGHDLVEAQPLEQVAQQARQASRAKPRFRNRGPIRNPTSAARLRGLRSK